MYYSVPQTDNNHGKLFFPFVITVVMNEVHCYARQSPYCLLQNGTAFTVFLWSCAPCSAITAQYIILEKQIGLMALGILQFSLRARNSFCA